jgi:hypothetical protein
MLVPAQPGTPIEVPLFAHAILWPVLLIWASFLYRRRRTHRWPLSRQLGVVLVPLCFLADGGALAAARTWPTAASNSFVFALLWAAFAVSLTAYFALGAPGDDGPNDAEEAEPEPPWWPDFERKFRDYTRGGPNAPAPERPKTPASVA